MLLLNKTVAALAVLLLAGISSTHPGKEEEEERQALARRATVHAYRRSLNLCQSSLREDGIQGRIQARHQAKAQKLRAELELYKLKSISQKRSINATSVLAKNHNETSKYPNVTVNTPEESFFKNTSSCILVPEVTEGPYWVSGEYVRNDLRESQKGVDLYLDVQIIDVSTCRPLSYVYAEFWHANSTGVYSGVVADGNGEGDIADSNLNSTFLRGLAPTDKDGVVEVITLVPGHYVGRTNHIHIMAHQNGIVARNHTYINSTITHVGQMFFDQTLLSAVEATLPYSENDQAQTENSEDSIFESEADGYDPVLSYVYLGSEVADGLFAWTTIGINASAAYDPSPAAFWTKAGGVENQDGNGGLGGGAPPSGGMNGTGGNSSGLPPSGAAPSQSGMPTGTSQS